MKHLIIYAHPNPASYNHAIMQSLSEILEKNNEVRVRDLYGIGFDSLLKSSDFVSFQNNSTPDDIRKEQEHIKWADVITFIFPIWWFQMPSILKGYIDRVFSKGFAYDFGEDAMKGLLMGKEVIILNTTGGPKESYTQGGYLSALGVIIEDGIFKFCGMKVIMHKFFYAIPFIDEAERKQMLEDFKKDTLLLRIAESKVKVK